MSRRQQDEMLDITTAVYPPTDPRALGSGGEWDLDGDGVVDDPAGARQAYGPGDGEVCRNGFVLSSSLCDTVGEFYLVSGYDVAVVEAVGGPRVERRYGLNWTLVGRWQRSRIDTGKPGQRPGRSASARLPRPSWQHSCDVEQLPPPLRQWQPDSQRRSGHRPVPRWISQGLRFD